MKKILIIGKRGFIGNSLSKYLKKKFKVTHKSFADLKKFGSNIDNFNCVINTSINKRYIEKRYNEKFDNDLKISNFIKNDKTKFIFLSTRKVYKSKANIVENSELFPKTNYSKNKLISENKLTKKISKNLVVLRISNIIGDKSKIKRIHNTFIDIFYQNIKRGLMFDNKKDFKDFISIDKFCEIMKNIITKDLKGIFNVSIGKKIYLNDIVFWLNKFNKKKIILKKSKIKNDCFFLNNKKLMSKIKIENSKKELKEYCLKISKKKFS